MAQFALVGISNASSPSSSSDPIRARPAGQLGFLRPPDFRLQHVADPTATFLSRAQHTVESSSLVILTADYINAAVFCRIIIRGPRGACTSDELVGLLSVHSVHPRATRRAGKVNPCVVVVQFIAPCRHNAIAFSRLALQDPHSHFASRRVWAWTRPLRRESVGLGAQPQR